MGPPWGAFCQITFASCSLCKGPRLRRLEIMSMILATYPSYRPSACTHTTWKCSCPRHCGSVVWICVLRSRSFACMLWSHCDCFCLSNAMHGQNINLPVCVCLCLFVTLSVDLPTGQTPQWIFTVDSLKDADLRNDVPFGGLCHAPDCQELT